MREASHRRVGGCAGQGLVIAVWVAGAVAAGATPMDDWEGSPGGGRGTPVDLGLEAAPAGEEAVGVAPDSVSVLEQEVELPQPFQGLLAAAPPQEAAPAPSTPAPAPAATAGTPSAERSEDAPGPVSSVLLRHHLRLAHMMALEGDFEGAAGSAGRAVEIDPDAPEARIELGFALLRLGRFDEADTHLRRARELGADSAQLYAALAAAARGQGQLRDAVRYGREALRRDPSLLLAANNLAWLLATAPDVALRDPEASIRIAQQALRDGGDSNPRILDTLAAGYAAAGRYAEAVETAERAEDLAREQGAGELASSIHQHLERYRAGEAYVDS